MLPEGGLKALQNQAKKFLDPALFWSSRTTWTFFGAIFALKKWASPHSKIFENLTIFTRRLEVSANEASFTADQKNWLKIEPQKIGHFFNEKSIVLKAFFKVWKCQGTHQLWFLKLQMPTNSNRKLFLVSTGSSPNNRGLRPYFWGENWKNQLLLSFFNSKPYIFIIKSNSTCFQVSLEVMNIFVS